MKILFLGEITGRCGIGTVKAEVKKLKASEGIDFVVANAEGATGGWGCGAQSSETLHHMGIDVITLGEKAFYKIDMVTQVAKKPFILRPANYPETVPGRGIGYYVVKNNKICVVNILGMFGFTGPHLTNPFNIIEEICLRARKQTPYVFVIFHAQATAEKQAMGFLLDGKVSAVVGTHTKVLTADSCILSHGTAYISDAGRCGSLDSVGGFDAVNETEKLRTGLPSVSMESWKRPVLQGLICSFDENGNAVEVKPVCTECAVSKPE